MELGALSKIETWGSPTLEGFDLNSAQPGQRLRGLKRQFVRFYKKKVVQVYAKDAEIHPVTGAAKVLSTGTREIEREFVEIITPGDKNTVDDFAEDFHRREHWQEYKAFRDGTGIPLGTNLDECAYVSAPLVTELKYLGCHTEEQLADASDLLCDRIPNGHELREFARGMCKAKTDNKNLGQVSILKSELVKAQDMIRELQAQMKGVISGPEVEKVVEVNETVRRGPGRPKKLEINTEG